MLVWVEGDGEVTVVGFADGSSSPQAAASRATMVEGRRVRTFIGDAPCEGPSTAS
jgi:hypothetical protein